MGFQSAEISDRNTLIVNAPVDERRNGLATSNAEAFTELKTIICVSYVPVYSPSYAKPYIHHHKKERKYSKSAQYMYNETWEAIRIKVTMNWYASENIVPHTLRQRIVTV